MTVSFFYLSWTLTWQLVRGVSDYSFVYDAHQPTVNVRRVLSACNLTYTNSNTCVTAHVNMQTAITCCSEDHLDQSTSLVGAWGWYMFMFGSMKKLLCGFYSKWGTKGYCNMDKWQGKQPKRNSLLEEVGWIIAEEKPKKKRWVLGVPFSTAGLHIRIVLRDNSIAECACACLYEPLYWNAGPGHSAAHSFNFCKQTNSRRLQDHTVALVKH